ncbi:MAG: 23S rRNA (pseudouridine(1915)-N(3))-methyltransferase RlmH [Candidatus Krumholzibacteriia bacterium]
MIRIVAVGRLKDGRVAEMVDEYALRCRSLGGVVEVVEVRDSDPDREADAMLRRLGSAAGQELVVALDERGEAVTSRELAAILGQHGAVAFLIGGPDGLGAAARDRANRTLRLSRLTLPHELARLVLTEQVYRGLSILRGRPYHRD